VIGVFDSGIGGLSILRALRAELPDENFIYIADSGHAPYGERDDAHVMVRARALTAHLVGQGIDALVVACNTATAAAIHRLRADYPQLPIIGVEPALKPAVALSRTGRIGVMATRSTLNSVKFQQLLASLEGQAKFVLRACDGLAAAIEKSVANTAGGAAEIAASCALHTGAMGRFGNGPGDIDTLVLGCTHYPFATEVLRDLLGRQLRLVDTGEPVARQTRARLPARPAGRLSQAPLTLLSTGHPEVLQAAARRWIAPGITAQALDIPSALLPGH
jgi:glutamate racemase